MDIQCPKCGKRGKISSVSASEENKALNCPDCKHRFFISEIAQVHPELQFADDPDMLMRCENNIDKLKRELEQYNTALLDSKKDDELKGLKERIAIAKRRLDMYENIKASYEVDIELRNNSKALSNVVTQPVTAKQPEIRIDNKVAVSVKPGAAKSATNGFMIGIAAGLLLFLVGIGLLWIPVVGWVLGPLFIISAFIAPFILSGALAIKGALKHLQGSCPYCEAPITIIQKNGIHGIDCIVCKERIIVSNNAFLKKDS